jgi:tetratricopeptide (TPR) repeat protein
MHEIEPDQGASVSTSQDDGIASNEDVARGIALEGRAGDGKTAQVLAAEQIEFLRRQGALQIEQKTLLQSEKRLLQSQNDGQLIQNRRDRLRIVMDVTLSLSVLLLVSILAGQIYAAWRADNVVIGAFDVPPALDTQGLTGKVVAAGLLDRLQQFQSETRSSVAKRGVNDAWSNDVKLEIPEAHISIGELQRYLRDWLGHEAHIGGSIVQQADGTLALTVRGNGFAARTFSGKLEALPALTTQAAEYIYGASETYRFGVYMVDHGRDDEAIALVKAAYSAALPSDQPLLLNVWGLALGDQGHNEEALEKLRQAVALKPDYWIGYNNIMNFQTVLQQEEAVFQIGLQMEREARRGQWFAKDVQQLLFQNFDLLRWDLRGVHKGNVEDMAISGGHGTGATEGAPADAQLLAQLHEWRAAQLELETSPGAGKDPYVIAQSDFVTGLIALDQGDQAHALEPLHRTLTAIDTQADLAASFNGPSCWLALAEEWAGQRERADADIARGGHLVDCYRFKADISDHRGDWVLAQKQYAEAVALAPSVPSSYYSWGVALARRSDYDGAIAKFTEANARGPHWADPLKEWGDALAAKQDYKAALEHYEQAENYAPNWGALHLRWGEALDKLDKHSAALEQYRKAQQLDLANADKKTLTGHLGG